MFRRNQKSITFKLTLGFLAIVLVSTLFIGIIALNIFKNNIFEVKKNNMQKHATAISETIKPYVGNSLSNEEFVKMIHLINDIDNARIWILRPDKSIITASDTDNDIKYINDPEIKNLYDDINSKVLDGEETYDEGYNPYYNEEMMIIAAGFNSGKTMYDLAKEKGMTEDEFKASLLEERTKAIDKAVADGTITKENGDSMKETLKNNMDTCTGIPGQGMNKSGTGNGYGKNAGGKGTVKGHMSASGSRGSANCNYNDTSN